jgi:hypothetical protein
MAAADPDYASVPLVGKLVATMPLVARSVCHIQTTTNAGKPFRPTAGKRRPRIVGCQSFEGLAAKQPACRFVGLGHHP